MRFLKRFWLRTSNEAQVSRKPRVSGFAAGLGLFLVGLICSFFLTFPNEVLRERIVAELENRLPVKVDLVAVTVHPMLTLTGKQMTVRLSGQPEILFQIDRFHVDPLWVGLLSGDPGIEGEINSSTGALSFVSQRSGMLEMIGTNLPFDIPLATSPAMRFAGTLKAGQVATAVPLQSVTESRIDINLEQVAVRGLEALTASAAGLGFGELSLQMTGQGSSFTIERLETSGGDLVVSGEGTLMLVTAKPQNSRVNLTLSVRAGRQADPTLVSLLDLVGTQQSDGSRKLRLTGTLGEPVIR